MKKLLKHILFLFSIFIFVALFVYTHWYYYDLPTIIDSKIITKEQDLKAVTSQWFSNYFNQFENLTTPLPYRIKNPTLNDIKVLDQENNIVQIEFSYHPVADNQKIAYVFGDSTPDGFNYHVQTILEFSKQKDTYTVTDQLTFTQYQIKTDPSIHNIPPKPVPYEMEDKDETYVFKNQELYVTYNHGKNLTKVPIPYDEIIMENGHYRELLPDHGFIISKDFTAIVGYDDPGCYLLYSTDMGKTWNKSQVARSLFQTDFLSLSKTENYCYLTIAVDRSLGHNYYATFKTNDFQSWENLQFADSLNPLNAFFVKDNVAYFNAGQDEKGNCRISYTQDDGKTLTNISLPTHKVNFNDYVLTPFDSMEYAYIENGITYIVVGQGSDGDYSKNGVLLKALYESKDGIHFNFVKEIEEHHNIAG